MTALQSRASRSEWFSRIEDWQKSGLTQVDYCRQHQFSLSSFYHWIGNIAKRNRIRHWKAHRIQKSLFLCRSHFHQDMGRSS